MLALDFVGDWAAARVGGGAVAEALGDEAAGGRVQFGEAARAGDGAAADATVGADRAGHSFKYIAALQAAEQAGTAPDLVRIEARAGHGSGKPTSKIIEETADVFAFLRDFTGLDPK